MSNEKRRNGNDSWVECGNTDGGVPVVRFQFEVAFVMLQCEDGGDDPSLERHFRGHRAPLAALAFAPDAQKLASVSADKSLMLWNFQRTERCYRFEGHTDAITDVSYAPNGRLIASCSRDRSIRLWAPTIKGATGEFRAHLQTVRSVDFSPCGNRLISSSDDKTLKLWTVYRKKFLQSYVGHRNWVRCARFSSDGSMIASCSDDKSVKVWDINSTDCIHTYQELKGHGVHLAWHPSSFYMAVGLSNGTVKLYDTRMHTLIQHYRAHEETITQICFHSSGNFLLVASQDKTMKILDLLEGHPIYTLVGHNGPITAVAFSRNGEYFASGGADKQIMVWKTNFVPAYDNDSKENITNFNTSCESKNVTDKKSRILDARKSTIFGNKQDEESYESLSISQYMKDDKFRSHTFLNDSLDIIMTDSEDHMPRPIPHKSILNISKYDKIYYNNDSNEKILVKRLLTIDSGMYTIMSSIICHLNDVHDIIHIIDQRLTLLENCLY